MAVDYHTIGAVGAANISILILITILRCIRWYRKWEGNRHERKFYKILAFHIFLILTTAVELPLYIGFIIIGTYDVYAYSFHKFQSMFLFAALSITIHDWSSVLYDLHEYPIYTFFFRKLTLSILNSVYIIISLINFIFCYWTADLNDYSSNPIYLIGIFFQICMSMFLTCFMLHAGLKLYGRIQGAAGKQQPHQHHQQQQQVIVPPSIPLPSSYQLYHPTVASPPPQNLSNLVANNGNTSNSNNSAPPLPPSLCPPSPAQGSGPLTTTTSNPGFLNRLRTGTYDSNQFSDTTNSTTTLGTASMTPTTNPIQAGNNPQPPPTQYLVSIPTANQAPNTQVNDNSLEFRIALLNLNVVMATCTVCIMLQIIMVILNYALDYENDTDKTVGPPLLFWACYSWIPIWGPVLSLLYLSRSQFGRKKTTNPTSQRFLSTDSPQAYALRSPLIGPSDYSDGVRTDSENGNSPSRSGFVQSHNFTRDLLSDEFGGGGPTPDQSRSYERFYGDLAFEHADTMTVDTNDTEENILVSAERGGGAVEGGSQLMSPEDSMNYLYRDTTATNPLPSDLHFANVLRNNFSQFFHQHHQDFSYRGEEEHNGQYR